jgi:threonine/homoserine/homoserine lactone efflux protein
MMTQLFGFVAVSALVICAPGPDTALTIRNSIVGGRRGGMLTAGGIAAGQLVWTIATSLGIAGLLQASQPAFTALKIIGAAYLVWLGFQSILAAIRGRPSHEGPKIRYQLGRWNAMRQGLTSNLANPKMAVFFLSLLHSSCRSPPVALPDSRCSELCSVR